MAPTIQTQIAIGVGSVFLTILGGLIVKKIRKDKIPTEWKEVGIVKQLYLYPLKSGKGLRKDKVFCTRKGIKVVNKNGCGIELRDRSFLIYTSKGREVRTARQLPKTVLIEIQAAEKGIILSAPNKTDLYISVPQIKNNVKAISVWSSTFGNETFTCTDSGESAAKWISNFLLGKDEGLRLGYGDGSSYRNLVKDHKKWAQHYTNIDNMMAGIFSDLAAMHLINQASIHDLNEKLLNDQKVSVVNFRPNVVVEGPDAFQEDHWKYIKMGEVVVKVCLECLRCIETTVSPTGEMNKQREPLKTLERYRKSDGPFKSPAMGIYLKVIKTGIISEEDVIYVSKNI